MAGHIFKSFCRTARSLLLSLIFAFLPLIGTTDAAENADWDGRWLFYTLLANGQPAEEKIPGAIDVRNGEVKGLWAGCFWLPVESFSISGNLLQARFTPAGADYTYTLVRIGPDLASSHYSEGDNESVMSPSHRDYARRLPLPEDCPSGMPKPP